MVKVMGSNPGYLISEIFEKYLKEIPMQFELTVAFSLIEDF